MTISDSVPTLGGYSEALRPEARPLEYAHLDQQQQAALTRIVGLLTAATASATQAPKAPSLDRAGGAVRSMAMMPVPYLESMRSSRNILICGERGTGKTTLMRSLAKMLTADVEPDGIPDRTLPNDVADQILALHRRLVWLETLDMEPIATEANLLGAVLARVEDAVGAHLLDVDKPTETVSLLHPGVGFHDVSRDLGRLQTSVALTFGGNLAERAGSLDPDTFAVESRRTERERLGLDRRFAMVLAGLSTALGGVSVQLTAPVFVLPVDDVDLNVSDCVPLLRLLRAASSPHLIVVLAADVGLLSTILRLWYQGELARISTPVLLNTDDTRTAIDLAANALRKHLPPAQRVVLGLVEPGRALALKPLGPGTPCLSQVLGPVDLPSDSAALNISGGFGLDLADMARMEHVSSPRWPATPDEDPARLAVRLAPFSWLHVLHQPLRSLVDLYLDCTVRADQAQVRPRLAHDVTDTPLVQLALARAQAGRPNVEGDTSGLDVSAWLDERPEAPSGQKVAVRKLNWHGWKAYVGAAPLEMAGARSLLGAAELLGDRWAEGSYGSFAPVPYMPATRATQWVSTDDEGWVDWPWVTHSTFWGYERALVWLAEADDLWNGKDYADFGSWIAVMTAQLFDTPADGEPFDRPTAPFAADWPSLEDRLTTLELGDGSTLSDVWLDAVGLLCTPEMGMTDLATIPMFLSPSRVDRVQSLRANRARSYPPLLRELALSWRATRSSPRPHQTSATASKEEEPEEAMESSRSGESGGRMTTGAQKTAGKRARTAAQRGSSAATTGRGGPA